MRGVPPLATVLAAGVLLAMAGCVRWTHLAPAELQAHGKAGQVCSAAVTPLVWSANTVLFPVSVASLGDKTPSHDNLGYPGLAVENAAYFACATLGLPLHALGWGTERLFFLLASREAIEDHLIERLPDLSRDDYARLVRTSGRTCPPPYDHEPGQTQPPLAADAAPREFGLWSAAQAPRFGSRPRLGNPFAAAEWHRWRTAGRPRDASGETFFVVNRALEFSDPASLFAAIYGGAQLVRFETELAAQQGRVTALAASGTEAALSAAGRDPSPLLRAAAARGLVRSGNERSAGELIRLLEDKAVMVRAAAAEALATRADPASVPALGRALSDAETLIRERAALALGKIGSEAAAGVLLSSLGNLGHRGRFEALSALADAGTPSAREALSRALADNDLHTRIAAAAAIGRAAADPADPLFVSALSDPDPRISVAAARARERRGGVRASP